MSARALRRIAALIAFGGILAGTGIGYARASVFDPDPYRQPTEDVAGEWFTPAVTYAPTEWGAVGGILR